MNVRVIFSKKPATELSPPSAVIQPQFEITDTDQAELLGVRRMSDHPNG
jgi:hypothetical protein